MERLRWVRIPAVIVATTLLFAACGKTPTSAITGANALQTQFARGGIPGRPGGGDAGTGGGGNATGFSGEATAVQATVLGIQTTLGHAGPLAASGGSEEASLLTANVPGVLTAGVLHATTIGQGDRSRSEASVADLNLTVGGHTIGATFLMSRAEARCTGSGATTSGSSEIANLVVDGQSVTVTGAPNQTIALPLGAGQIVINEQSESPGSITVNALHVTVNGIADVVIASAHADVTCGSGNGNCTGGDFVTGGGWITGTPSGARGTFGVAGGIKHNGFWGHLTYIDHGAGGPKVKGTGVTGYTVVGPTTRQITGTCDIDGAGGFTYTCTVSDNGEPGRNDTFDLTLSNGYHAGGTLIGGNIQLHTHCH